QLSESARSLAYVVYPPPRSSSRRSMSWRMTLNVQSKKPRAIASRSTTTRRWASEKSSCVRLRAAQQQDAADEVRAPRWRPSQLILVFGGRQRDRTTPHGQ